MCYTVGMPNPHPREDGLQTHTGPGMPKEWIRKLLEATTVRDTTRIRHESITPSEYGSRAPGSQPDPVPFGTIFTLEFTPNSDTAYRVFKIPDYFVGEASFHIHWTKSGDVDESGRNVKWRISYHVFDGGPQEGGESESLVNAVTTPTVLEYEDTYLNSSFLANDRYQYRTANLDAPGFIPSWYVGVCVEAVTPDGTALLNDPALISLDLIWREYINREMNYTL